MGQTASKTPRSRVQEVVQAKEAMFLYTLCWHGAPVQKGADAQAGPPVPLYDSDDETTDSAVVSALAMTDPADLSTARYKTSLERAHSGNHRLPVHAPILQSLSQPIHASAQGADRASMQKRNSPQQQPAQNTLAAAVAAASGHPSSSKHTSPSSRASSGSSGSQHRRFRYKESTMTAAAAAAAATMAMAAAAAIARQAGAARTKFALQAPRLQQQSLRYSSNSKVVVPLSAAALDAVGAPCRIGGDLPPESLLSHRGSGADVVGLRPYHHLHMMQLHRQHNQQQYEQQQKQQVQQAICAQAQAQAVWGWNVGGSVAQIAT